MFYECSSLTNINLSNFNTQYVTDMSDMFWGCKSLKKENIICKDKKIEKNFMNEEEIKNCEIKINDKLIPFNYFYKFPSKGNYIIRYTFREHTPHISNILSLKIR